MDKPPAGAMVVDRATPYGPIRLYMKSQRNAVATVVLIHGTPGSSGAWSSQFNPSLENVDVIAYDRPGFGQSGDAPGWPTLDYQVRVLREAIFSKPMKTPVFLIGHSYGGPVALQMAVLHPDLVRGALLIGGAVDPAQERVLPVQKFAALDLIRLLLPTPVRTSNEELMTLKSDLRKLEPQLAQLRVPVIMLHGTQDENVPVENVAYLETKLAHAGHSDLFEKRVYSGINHFIPWQHPELVQASLASLEAHAAKLAPAK